jgi:anion-transporting  ArsA/GET3 family ATPase
VASLLDLRLLFVTGKGGVGKTTVATALALSASEAGKKVLLCEVEPKGDLSVALECGSTPFTGREVTPRLVAMSMDTEASLREYLKLQMKVPIVGRIGPVARAFDFVATAAPGVREILTIGKLCYEVRENHYDLVVVDAPPTGHVVGHLAAPASINDLVKVGRVRSQTGWMLEILGDQSLTGACIVTTPEEMPVSETLDLADRLASETVVHLAAVVANRVLPELFGRGEEVVFEALARPKGRSALARTARATTTLSTTGRVGEILDSARLAVRLRRRGAGHLERLRCELAPGTPILYLPFLFGRAHGLRAVRLVAAALEEEMAEW